MRILIFTSGYTTKGKVVLEYLSKNSFFLEKFEISLVLDRDSQHIVSKYGKTFDILNYPSIQLNDLHVFDYIISIGWGKIIPKEVIRKAKKGALNCHSSLLPDYKGASVYYHHWANYEPYGGATIHFMEEKLDSGNLLAQSAFKINFFDTPSKILQKASELTGPLLVEAILKVENGYLGSANCGGRYFYKPKSMLQLLGYRALNIVLQLAKQPRRFMQHQ